MTQGPVVGIDLGGTNLRAGLYEDTVLGGGEAPACVAEITREIGEPRDPETITQLVSSTVTSLCSGQPAAAIIPVGLGFAGMFRGLDGVVANSPHMRWRNVALGAQLRAALGAKHPLWVGNDVNAICYGEYAAGAARGARHVLTVFIGTGIGGAMVVDGKLVEGASNCAGEIGHTKVIFDETAMACACGLRGCVEAYAGGASLVRRIKRDLLAGQRSAALVLAGSVDDIHPGHVDAAAGNGDPYAQALWSEVASLAGAAIANAVSVLNPSHVVLGGGVLSRTPVFREYLEAAYRVTVNPPAGDAAVLLPAELGDRAGMLGSAFLAAATSGAPRRKRDAG